MNDILLCYGTVTVNTSISVFIFPYGVSCLLLRVPLSVSEIYIDHSPYIVDSLTEIGARVFSYPIAPVRPSQDGERGERLTNTLSGAKHGGHHHQERALALTSCVARHDVARYEVTALAVLTGPDWAPYGKNTRDPFFISQQSISQRVNQRYRE